MERQAVDAGVELLNVRQAAHRLGVSEYLLRALVHRGQLTAVRFGRMMRFEPKEVERFITASRRVLEV